MKVKLSPQYKQTKEEVWNSVFGNLSDEESHTSAKKTFRLWPALTLVASICLVLTLSARFYTTEIVSPRAEHKTILLPDNSNVTLNADSKISYHPFWWIFKRELSLEGEAFFKVTKGRKFRVNTQHGNVQVLGTSFNVFSRANRFETFCLTGSVRVVSGENKTVLKPMEQSRYSNRKLVVEKISPTLQPSGWINGQFCFDRIPLIDVIHEIERQYNIRVLIPQEHNYIYSGNFSRTKDPAEVLHIVGAPFGIELRIAAQK